MPKKNKKDIPDRRSKQSSVSRTTNPEEKKSVYEIKFDDNTSEFERDILKENLPKLSYITRLFTYVFSSARVMCGIFLGLSIILSVLQPVTAFLWGSYIDNANGYADTVMLTIQWASLIGLAVLYWFINFVSNLMNGYLYGGEDIQRLSKVQDHRLQEKFQTKMLQKIARLYPDYMEVPRINDIINRSFDAMGGEWSSLQRGVIIEGYVLIAKAFSVVMVAASSYLFHPLLCLIVLVAPIPTLYTTYMGNKLNFKFTRDNGKVLREAGYYQGVLLGGSAKEVKALNLFDFFFTKWKALADDYTIREKKNQMHIFLLGTVSGFITNIANLAANVFAIILLTQGRLSIGALGAVLALIGTLMGNTTWLFGSIATFISKKNEAAQFFELLDLNEQDESHTAGRTIHEKPPRTVLLANAAGDKQQPSFNIERLEAKNVTYRYPLTDEYRIKDVCFTIHQGERVAFVGENGAGKTTFIKLLTGVLQPSDGDILLNGENVKKIVSAARHDSMSYVFQETLRFNTFTVGDNVFLGDVMLERDEDRIDEALAFAGLNVSSHSEPADMNDSSPAQLELGFEGLDKNAMLGKDIGGIELSGGQWQKLAIARAYYRDRGFIILDEPTSNLDPLAEAEVFKKYLAMSKGKTVIMVTHRISVASLADRVVVFKDGEIVEDGSHDALLLNNGEYARLYSTQAQWYDR
jgi:ATP-binding cassette subfamily B protein